MSKLKWFFLLMASLSGLSRLLFNFCGGSLGLQHCTVLTVRVICTLVSGLYSQVYWHLNFTATGLGHIIGPSHAATARHVSHVWWCLEAVAFSDYRMKLPWLFINWINISRIFANKLWFAISGDNLLTNVPISGEYNFIYCLVTWSAVRRGFHIINHRVHVCSAAEDVGGG